jgi:hypothetical protein
MPFFILDHPEYATDYQDSRQNPLEAKERLFMPGYQCSACHQTWAGSHRRYHPFHTTNRALLKRLTHPWPMKDAEWHAFAAEVRAALHVPDTFILQPGDYLGIPTVEVRSARLHDFTFLPIGRIIVNETVLDVLQTAGFRGFVVQPCQVRVGKKAQAAYPQPPRLFELVVTGRAWLVGSDPQNVQTCAVCQHAAFIADYDVTREYLLEIDETRWDGSDLFLVNNNPNITFVTEQVCQVLAAHQCTNYVCNPTVLQKII